MPKVTDVYLTEKREYILACTGEILKEKPLYQITMRDIIKEAGFSQGAIYRYYSSLDDIYVDFINQHTPAHPLEKEIDVLLESTQTAKTILTECFIAMGSYIEALLTSIVGQTFFELTVLYAYDTEKRDAILSQLAFKQSLAYAQQKIVEYALHNVEKGVFRPQIPVRSILLFVSSFIDGIAQSVAIHTAAGSNENIAAASDIAEMFETLAKAVIGFLEG